MKNKQLTSKSLAGSLSLKHHFYSPNTTEIVLSLIFLGLLSYILAFLSREGKY